MRASDGTTETDFNRNTIWEDEEAVISDGSGVIPIAFAIPADGRQTRARTKSRDDFSIEWRLTAQEADGGREGYSGDFDLPGFSVPGTAEQNAHVYAIHRGRHRELEEQQTGADLGVTNNRTPTVGLDFCL